jgi:hypothetical protein
MPLPHSGQVPLHVRTARARLAKIWDLIMANVDDVAAHLAGRDPNQKEAFRLLNGFSISDMLADETNFAGGYRAFRSGRISSWNMSEFLINY